MDVTFLGTGAAWRAPELNCECLICQEMRRKNEKGDRTALLLRDKTNLLVDCGPDIVSQLTRHHAERIDGVRISHEHGDHYMLLADFRSYVEAQERAGALYADSRVWAAAAIRNVAAMGYFSSDRAIREYAEKVWDLVPVEVNVNR